MPSRAPGYGYTGVKGLGALLATVSSASSAPVIVATRLRKGSANSARGAARLVAEAITTTSSAGASGLMVLRADSAYYGADVIAAARRHRARFSITARKDRAVRAAISSIGEDAWSTIRYPNAVFDDQLQQWVSDAEVAEIEFTAFTSKRKARSLPRTALEPRAIRRYGRNQLVPRPAPTACRCPAKEASALDCFPLG